MVQAVVGLRSEAGRVYGITYLDGGDLGGMLLDSYSGRGEAWKLIKRGNVYGNDHGAEAAKFDHVEQLKGWAADKGAEILYYYDEVTRTWFSVLLHTYNDPFADKQRFSVLRRATDPRRTYYILLPA